MRPSRSPIVLALDTPDLDEARAWAAAAGPAIGMVKVGLELFGAQGPQAVRALVADGHRVMLDLKLHDIPATVGRAVAALDPLGVELLTVHASGGAAMLRAALEAATGGTAIAAVTVLTSLDSDDLAELGFARPDAAVERLARVALEAGCRALVCGDPGRGARRRRRPAGGRPADHQGGRPGSGGRGHQG